MELTKLIQKHLKELEALNKKTPISPRKKKTEQIILMVQRMLKAVNLQPKIKDNTPPPVNPFKSKLTSQGQMEPKKIDNKDAPKNTFKAKPIKETKSIKIENKKPSKKNPFKKDKSIDKEVPKEKPKRKKAKKKSVILADNVKNDLKGEFEK